ncbi:MULTISPECIES: chemotaxis protein [Vibrio]|uniref:chemotaxis protein n=1 Tax=Vibrio TaxID=662 RepID=UPI000E5490DC|nr:MULTISPECIES: chemotaxis protein [Vibrio]AXT71339.1 chemotaxis protein [Vibrio sp. dhg]MCG9700524.1 chemotaxis protein [Vibrio natriegens]
MSAHRIFSMMVMWVAMTISGCSLLSVKIDSQTVPLTKQELNMRILTREYALQYFAQVEQAADSLEAKYDPNDQINQSYLLLWKINAEEGLQASAYQVTPMAGLIDTWVFAHQVDEFFATGAGSNLFATDEAKNVSEHLANEVDKLAQSILKKEVYDNTKPFVANFVKQHPFADLSMIRTPAYRAWLEFSQISEEEAVMTLGTMPEALGDVSDRLSLASKQAPKIMTWKAQLLALNSSASIEKVNAALNSLQVTADSMRDFIDNNPEYMRYLAEQMALELQPLVDDIDMKTEARLSQLGEERQALEEMVARERQEIALIITHEREKFAQDIDRVSQQVVDLAMTKLIELVRSTIIYFILFVIAIFFAPLGLGYVLGKRASVKANIKES